MAENKKYPENYAEEGGYVFCPVCGDKVSAGARFCTSCGSSLADASNMEDVYGGPEYFETKKKSMGRVYAGPEPVDKKDDPIAGVYAGPEYFDKKGERMALLYAGPEYFGKVDKARAAADEYLGALSSDAVSYTGANKDNTFTFFSQYMLAEEMKNRLMADAQIEVSTDEARVIQIQFICSEDEAKVKEAKQKIDAGEVFYEVAAGVNSDSDFDAELTRGMTDKTFEDVAYSLKTGEVSDVFLSGDKYYLIKCSSDNEQTKTDAHREVLTEKEKAEYLEKKIVPFENGLYFEFDESGWNKIQFDKIPETGVTFREIYLKNTQVQ